MGACLVRCLAQCSLRVGQPQLHRGIPSAGVPLEQWLMASPQLRVQDHAITPRNDSRISQQTQITIIVSVKRIAHLSTLLDCFMASREASVGVEAETGSFSLLVVSVFSVDLDP